MLDHVDIYGYAALVSMTCPLRVLKSLVSPCSMDSLQLRRTILRALS